MWKLYQFQPELLFKSTGQFIVGACACDRKNYSCFPSTCFNYHCEPNWRSHLCWSWSAHNPLLRLIVWVQIVNFFKLMRLVLDMTDIHKIFDSPERAEGKVNSGSLPARTWWCPPGVLMPLGGVSSSATLGSPSHLRRPSQLGADPSPEDAQAPWSHTNSRTPTGCSWHSISIYTH